MVESERRRLDSWKDIAAYLGRDVRTAIRWEERGLPVHRVPGGRTPRVFAYTNELDAWLKAGGDRRENGLPAPVPDARPREVAPRSRRRVRSFLFVGALILVSLAVVIAARPWERARRQAAKLSLTLNVLDASDAAGHTLWRHEFAGSARPASDDRPWSFTGDVDRDGRPDVLAAVELTERGTAPGVRLYRFDDAGRIVWSDGPADRLTFRNGDYGPPWASWDLNVYRAAGAPRIAWAVHHYTWWPSMLISYEPDGRRTGVFVNSGWIARSVGTADERHLAFVGLSNAHRAYVFGVLDATAPSGMSPEPAGSATECVSCRGGGLRHYFVFPRSDLSDRFLTSLEPPSLTTFDDGSFAVHVPDTSGLHAGGTIYEIGPDFRIRSMRVTDAYDQWHRRVVDAAHRVEDCPDRRERTVRHWTAGEWKLERVAAR